MSKLKLIGEIDCYQCGGQIHIEENMGIHNFIWERCSHCNTLNTIKVVINEGKISKRCE